MKFRTWVTAVLIILFFVSWFSLFADSFVQNWLGIFGMFITVYLLTKYSDICD